MAAPLPAEDRSATRGDADPPPGLRRPWTRQRVARLAFLAGQGFTAKIIGADPEVRASESNVYRQAHRLGFDVAGRAGVTLPLRLPAALQARLERRAAAAGLTAAGYARSLVATCLAAPEP